MNVMKQLLFFSILAFMGLCAMAQEPAISGQTKVTYTTISSPTKPEMDPRIHVTPDSLKIVAGVENKIQFTVDGVESKQLIVKVVTEDLCQMRKGEEFGQYYFTPKAKEGTIIIRVGAMDFMGAYMRIGDVQFAITE